ncbi:uncharacterized protein DAT39_016958, partial [Clarias magur]
MILTSAESNDSGTYTLHTFESNGKNTGIYGLQLNIEAPVSAVKVSYSCSSPGVMKVSCSADGDNLRFKWTSDLNTLSHPENGTGTLILDNDHHGTIACYVENHVSHDHIITELLPCPESTTVSSFAALSGDFLVFVSVWLFEIIILLSLLLGALYIFPRLYRKQRKTKTQVSSVKVHYSCSSPGVMNVSCSSDGDNLRFNWTSDLNKNLQLENGNRTLILVKDLHGKVICSVENHVSRDHITAELHPCPDRLLIILSLVFVLLIMISIFAFYMYKKKQGQKNKEASSQEGRELVYAQVAHLPMDRIETTPGMSQSRNEGVEYAEVVPRATKRKQKKKEDEVQYGELVFNTPARNKHKVAKEPDDCVYSHVQHSHAERNNSGTYTVDTFDVNGNNKGNYSLQLNIEAQVSSVKVSCNWLSPEVIKLSCSADGDNLRFNWTPDLNKTLQLENRTSTLILDKDHHGKVTCSVENHVSRDHITTERHPCPETTPVSGTTTANPAMNST